MGFFRFLGRHVGASIFGGVGIVLAALGYADQAQAIATGFEPWALQATGAVLFVISVVMILYRFDQERPASAPASAKPLPSAKPEKRPPQRPVETSPPVPAPAPPVSTEDRIFVAENLAPDALMKMCEGKTSHQGQRAIQPFLGKWFRLSGVCADFNMLGDDFAVVRFARAPIAVFQDSSLPDMRSVSAYFRSGFERLEMLQGGEQMVVDGKIKEIDVLTFKLDHCEIVSISPPERA